MFFNLKIKPSYQLSMFLILSLSFLNFSCRWVGESKIKPEVVEIKNQTPECFTDLGKSLESYLKSQISDEKISALFDCTKKSVDDFMRKTSEKDSEVGYTKNEIKSLLKSFLLKNGDDFKSERYARLFLIVKRALIGGDSDHLTRLEWKRIKILFPRIQKFFLDTKPYLQYYYFYNKTFYEDKKHDFKLLDITHKEFEIRVIDFFDELKTYGSLLNKNEILYVKDEIVSFDSLKKIEPLLNELIYIFYSFPLSQHQENWSDLIKLGERGLRVMTYVKKSALQPKGHSFEPNGAVATGALLRSIIDAFDVTYKVNSSGNLDQELVERFVLGLYQSGFFLHKVKNPDSIVSFVSDVGKSFFADENDKSWQSSEGSHWKISGSKINHFKFLYNRWIESLIASIKDSNLSDLKEQYNNLLFTDVDYEVDSKKQGDDIYNSVVNQSKINLVFPGLEYKINFQIPNNVSQQNDIKSRFYKTMMSNIVLLIFDTYGNQNRIDNNADKFVSEQTSARLYNDIREVTVAEGLGSPLSCDAGGRTFLEANLFAYSSNGNDKMEVQEALEWLTMATSSSSVASRLFTDISEIPDCVLPGESVYQNRPYLKKECVRNHIFQNYKKYFNHMPNLINFLESKKKVDDFYQNLFEVTRTCNDPNLPVSYDEIIYSVTLLGYIEALFERYDIDTSSYYIFSRPRNDLLEMDELSLAFDERFRAVLKRMAKIRNNKDLSDTAAEILFKKLLVLKRMPPIPEGKLQEYWWGVSDIGVTVKPLTRIDVYKVFNSILKMNEQKPVESFNYCSDLTLAWEEYQQQGVFRVKIPNRICEEKTSANTPRN
jgi:hypothetical protein